MSEIKTLGSYFGLLCVWLPNFTDTCASCSTLLRLEQFPFGRAKATLLGFVRGRELRVWGLGVYQCVHSNLKLKKEKKQLTTTPLIHRFAPERTHSPLNIMREKR